MPNYPKTVELTSFQGLNNVLPPERTPNTHLKVAENIDLDKSGGIHKRPGYSLKLSGSFHSLWGENNNFLAVKDNSLVRIKEDFTTSEIAPYAGHERVSYTSIEWSDDIFYVSKSAHGHIRGDKVSPIGYVPPTPPTLSEVTGNGQMTSGRYQVSLTYIDENGEESGARVSQVIDILGGSDIHVTNITSSSEDLITGINIYCSMPNGDILYKVGSTSNTSGTFIISGVHSQGVTPLKSFNMSPAPYGDIIRYYKGRLWIADGKTLWFSSPFSFKWFNLQTDFFQFESKITELMAVENGLWVGTEAGLFYMGGKTPDDMKLDLIEPLKVVAGTGERIVGSYLFIENTPIGYKWLVTTNKGILVCFNNGIALNLTETNVVFPEADSGVSSFLQIGGINRYLTLLEEKKPSNNAAASDIVTATVIRNGVTI